MNRVVVSKFTDPFVNLALESSLFEAAKPDSRLLFLYINKPCIVIGRNQNPWKECNIYASKSMDVPVIRRRSGGGAVVHDLGNVNFCVQTPRNEFSRTKHIDLIVSKLSEYGLKVNERHDILNAQGKKVSGSSFKIVRQRAYHHATMLLQSDLSALRALLKKDPNSGVITGLGTDSVSSPVANANIPPHVYMNAWMQVFKDEYNSQPVEIVSEISQDVYKDAEFMKTWEWNYGETPRFTHYIGPYQFTVNKGEVIEGPQEFIGKQYRNLPLGEYSRWVNA